MDGLTFDPANTTNTDTTQNIEGYDDHVEEIQNAYPEEDWRTPAQIEEENQAQQLQQQAGAEQGDPITEIADQVTQQVSDALGLEEPTEEAVEQAAIDPEVVSDEIEQFDWGNPNKDYNQHFIRMMDSRDEYGYIPTEMLRDREGKLFNDGIRRTQNLNWDYIEKEYNLWQNYDKNGGDLNLENQLNTINTIRNDPELLRRYDRNQDGKFTISDWHDMSRENLSPEEEEIMTEKWLRGLEDKSLIRRGKSFFRHWMYKGNLGILPMLEENPGRWGTLDTNMARFTGTRRLQALGPDQLMKEEGESSRQAQAGALFDIAANILSAPERLAEANRVQKEQGEHDPNNPLTWWDGDTFATHDAKADDFVLKHDNEMSLGYALNHPNNRVWSDKMMYEMTYYGVPIAATAIATGGASLGAGTLGATSLLGKGAAVLGTTSLAVGVETVPLALFRDLSEKGMGNMYEENTMLKRFAEAHPEHRMFGMQASHFIETPFGRQLAHVGDEVVFDGATQVALFGAGKGLRHMLPEGTRVASKYLKQFDTSKYPYSRDETTPLRNAKYWLDKKKQQLTDKIEAGRSQQRIGEEGPSSPWVRDPWTDSSLNTTYGDFKNGANQAGQEIAKIRSDVLEVSNQIDEAWGAVGWEGGSTDALLKPLEEAQFSKSGIPEPWLNNKVDEYWNNPNLKTQLNRLNPLDRTLGKYGKPTLSRIQEIVGRDAASLSPEEFWGKAFTDTPIKAGEVLDDVKAFVTKNLQVQDAVNMSLLKSLRDTANGAGEMIGNADIFAVGGPMRRIANNLVTGLTQVKKTQFTWDLARKMQKEAGSELTPDMIKQIDELVAKRSVELHQENMDGVRLMMQLMEDSDSDELAEAVLDVFKVSNDIHNWKDFDAWMRQKIRGGEFKGKVKTGALIHELQGVMVNSILSGPKTPMRALLGTTVNSYLNAINEAAGATLRQPFTNDIASRKASVAKLKGMFELIPEAMQVFRKNLKSKFNANIADIRTRYSEPMTRGDNNWHLFGEWTEKNGTAGDKAAFYMANVARNLNNNKLLSWSPRALAATD